MTKTAAGVVIGLVITILAGAAAWYYYVDTLKFSEIVGTDAEPRVQIFVKLFDFDTGLTRHDVHTLKTKSTYWERRMREVSAISDMHLRQQENEKLMAEMMQDPSMNKVVKRVFGFGMDTATALIRAIALQ